MIFVYLCSLTLTYLQWAKSLFVTSDHFVKMYKCIPFLKNNCPPLFFFRRSFLFPESMLARNLFWCFFFCGIGENIHFGFYGWKVIIFWCPIFNFFPDLQTSMSFCKDYLLVYNVLKFKETIRTFRRNISLSDVCESS